MDFGQVVLLVASLSFIGLGARPPSPEWGAMITEGATNFYQWWIAAAPGIAILLVVLAFNFVGDGLRDTFDVRDAVRRRAHDRAACCSLRDLRVTFDTPAGPARAVRGVDLDVLPGEAVAVVGETGSGKSVTMLAMLGLLQGAQVSGSALYRGTELVGLAPARCCAPCAAPRSSMVFQDPMTSLNPVLHDRPPARRW